MNQQSTTIQNKLKLISIKYITTQALMSFSNRLHTKYIHSSHNHEQTHTFNKKIITYWPGNHPETPI